MLIFLNMNLGHRDDLLTTWGCVCPSLRLGSHLGHRWASGLFNRAWRSIHPIAGCGGFFCLPSFLVSAIGRFIRSQSAVCFLSFSKRSLSCMATGSSVFYHSAFHWDCSLAVWNPLNAMRPETTCTKQSVAGDAVLAHMISDSLE